MPNFAPILLLSDLICSTQGTLNKCSNFMMTIKLCTWCQRSNFSRKRYCNQI